MKKTLFSLFILLMIFSQDIKGQDFIVPLYTGDIPYALTQRNQEEAVVGDDGILRISKVTIPDITVFLPSADLNTGKAVLICPGGGYGILASGHEGYDVAKAFAEVGIAGIVLKYRLPNDSLFTNSHLVPLYDAQQAMYLIRKNADKWKIDPHQIGVMGFSAGGHLAASLAVHTPILSFMIPTHSRAEQNSNKEVSVKPNFALLIYPVISSVAGITHEGSMRNLLGKQDNANWRRYFSCEAQVNSKTPPCFLVHAGDDSAVPVANSLLFYQALQEHKIESEMYIYAKGGHGFGLNNPTSKTRWFDLCVNWILR